MSFFRLNSEGVQQLLTELNASRVSLLGAQANTERRARLLGRIAEYLLVSLIVLVFAGIEIGRWYFRTPPQPVLICAFAAAITLYSGFRIWMVLPQLQVLARERESRRLLGAAVQSLCDRGYVLFEGVTNSRGWSLGSVLAGPNGVFCVIPRFVPHGKNLTETVLHPDQDSVKIGGREVMADPIGQARRAATELYELFAAAGLETIPVQPVVVFPGWTVQRAPGLEDPEVLVTGDQNLESEIRSFPGTLEPREVIAAGLALEKHTPPRAASRPTPA